MSASLLTLLALSWSTPATAAAPHPGEAAGDEALAELAEGRPQAAVRRIRRQLAREEDPERADALRCLLGRSLRLSGDEAGAVEVLAAVPLDAGCGRRAAFDRADALVALERTAEAAALYADAGALALGDDRDRLLADRMDALADRLRAGREGRVRSLGEQREARRRARMLRVAVLDLKLSDETRRERAAATGREVLADEADFSEFDSATARRAAAVLLETAGRDPAPETRRLVAALHRDADAWALVAGLPDDAETLRVRALVAHRLDARAALPHIERALQANPDDHGLRRMAMQTLVGGQRHGDALPHIERLVAAGLDDQAGLEEQLARSTAYVIADPRQRALKLAEGLAAWAERHPDAPRRPAVLLEIDQARMDAALLLPDPAAAVAELLALADDESGSELGEEARYLAGVIQAREGDADAAQATWELGLRRGSRTGQVKRVLWALALRRVHAGDRPEEALTWLQSQAETGPAPDVASRLRETLAEPTLVVEVPERLSARGTPEVVVHSRNVDRVQVRLHRIDAEGFLRATSGRGLLDSLDVAVVAPDKEWTVDVPAGTDLARQRWNLPLRGVGPGFWSVTVAAGEIEARAVALVSDSQLVARARGNDLVVGVTDGERPLSGVRVLAAHGSRISTARTGGDGIARLDVPDGQATVVVDGPRGPAMASLGWGAAGDDEQPLQLVAELDQPAWHPGEQARFRVVGRQDRAPISGRWELWLEAGGAVHPPVRVDADAEGALVGSLPVPAWHAGGPGVVDDGLRLYARAVGTQDRHAVASLPVVMDPAPARSLWVEDTDEGAVVHVVEADGRPVVDAAVELWEGAGERTVQRTGPGGRIAVQRPAEGVPWSLRARLASSGQAMATPRRRLGEEVEVERLSAWLPQDRIGDAPAVVEVEGPAGTRVEILVSAEVVLSGPVEKPSLSWEPELDGEGAGARSWDRVVPHEERAVVLQQSRVLSAVLDDEGHASVDLGVLPPGGHQVLVQAADPRLGSVSHRVERDAEGPVLGAVAAELPAGAEVALTARGPALVTVEGPGIVDAALVGSGGRTLGVDVPWTDGSLELVATGLGGAVHARTVKVDATLDVQLEVAEDGQSAVVRVTGPDGAPVDAQVLLSGGVRDGVLPWGFPVDLVQQLPWFGPNAGAVHAEHRRVGWHERIAAALLDEAARQAEADKARDLGSGFLGASGMDELVAEAEPMMLGLGSRGSGLGGGGTGYGRGSGASGYGRGSGVIGGRREVQQALRDAWVWQIERTGRDGELRVALPRPGAGQWQLRATALTRDASGADRVELDAGQRPWMAAGPGGIPLGPDDVARPVLHVVGGAVDETVRLELGERTEEVWAPAGAVVRVELGEVGPGQGAVAVLRDAEGVELGRQSVAPQVLAGTPDSQGERVVVRFSAGGGLPLLQLATEPDPAAVRSLDRAVAAGRVALEAAAGLNGDARAIALDRVRAAVAAARSAGLRSATTRGRAELLVLMSRAQTLLPDLAITRGELDEVAEGLEQAARDTDEALAVSWALAVAGREVDPSRIGRLLRDAEELEDAQRGWLARVLLALDRRDEARAVRLGNDPHGVLATAGLRLAPEPPGAWIQALPAVGDLDRAHHVAALLALPRGKAGTTAVLKVDGEVVDQRPLATAGGMERFVPRGATVTVEGAPGAVVARSTVASGERPLPAAVLPQGNDGRPLRVSAAAVLGDKEGRCGAEAPCVLAVGDALLLPQGRVPMTAVLPAGLAWDTPDRLRATLPGRWVVTGLSTMEGGEEVALAPLVVEVEAAVTHDPASLHRRVALALAEEAAAAAADPAAADPADAAPADASVLSWLAPWPAFDDWEGRDRSRVMALRFDAARERDDAEALVAAFEALRDADPAASLDLEDVAAVARAYDVVGRPGRAVDGWRAGLGAAFLGEIASARELDAIAGPLVALQAQRDLGLRYPGVSVVDEAAFHLPEQLAALADEGLPAELVSEGITPTDVRLLAAAWDREFLALHPDSPLVPQAGFHLAQGLLRLRAFEEAAAWADRVADGAPDAPDLDGLRYVEGLARAEQGQRAAARAIFQSLATGAWPQADGSTGPAGLQLDARYALARIAEAEGDLDAAREGYEEVAPSFPDAQRSLQALQAVALSPEPLLLLEPSDSAVLPLTVANVDELHLRAYKVDLRTIFLRDAGLDGVEHIQVAGVSPVWSGQRRVAVGPFPERTEVPLPLAGDGAWMVELDADGVEARTLVVRSPLALDADDSDGARRVVVRRGGNPAAGVEVRALDGSGGVVATRTDLRGVATVPGNAPVLAFDGPAVAFTLPGVDQGPPQPVYDFEDISIEGQLMQNLDQRVLQQRQKNFSGYEEKYRRSAPEALEASAF